MHQTTAGIDYPYLSVPSSPYLLHSSAKLLQPSDMNATVCYGLQQFATVCNRVKFRTELDKIRRLRERSNVAPVIRRCYHHCS